MFREPSRPSSHRAPRIQTRAALIRVKNFKDETAVHTSVTTALASIESCSCVACSTKRALQRRVSAAAVRHSSHGGDRSATCRDDERVDPVKDAEHQLRLRFALILRGRKPEVPLRASRERRQRRKYRVQRQMVRRSHEGERKRFAKRKQRKRATGESPRSGHPEGCVAWLRR